MSAITGLGLIFLCDTAQRQFNFKQKTVAIPTCYECVLFVVYRQAEKGIMVLKEVFFNTRMSDKAFHIYLSIYLSIYLDRKSTRLNSSHT